jgi:hypothetical protein
MQLRFVLFHSSIHINTNLCILNIPSKVRFLIFYFNILAHQKNKIIKNHPKEMQDVLSELGNN